MTFNVSVTNPEVIFVANFEFKNATFFQVSSKGQVTYVHKGFKADFNMTGEIEKRKNDRYIKLVDLNLQLSSSRIAYQFKTKDPKHDRVKDNVFNYNWKLALRDLKTGYEQIYAHAYRTTMERILAAFPYDSIFID
ncbi:hypothetical protein PPYR_08629 [Photinus pyralis]|uniref:Uncharacterized protein n=1 Tax=Photinus pyralis TaxID=7054 RepID=A0A5N4AK10_PHOPY|nr:uncharacterized protein LOC116170994 [Photinus pyralis]KAB0797636.1 hypothetical protein PPYR_08629 [Photinus pyralis]